MIVGMDFGTTNSGMAVFDGEQVNLLPLDPANANPRVLRTALYITNEQEVVIGRAAVDRYYEENLGRAVRTRKVWIGEIEVYAEDLYYVTDAYAWVDVTEPGRLMLSVKTRLREEDHPGAIVGPYFYSLEDLIALYLTVAKVRAEQLLGRDLTHVVLGRPVHFSFDDTHDRLAQGRLLQAAFRAGYETVYFEKEPIAAAYSYAQTIDAPQNVLVFDFGGGTLDITVMRLGEADGERVLATGGIPIAGDVFDQKLTRAKMPPHFGEGSLYGPRGKSLAMPSWIFDAFASWQTIIELQSLENKRILSDIARTAQRRRQVEALISLVSSNYGLKMFDTLEQAKRQLSEKRGTEIRLEGPDFHVRDFVTRTELERILREDVVSAESELRRTVSASGLALADIDAVIRTGGSAQIPAFQKLLTDLFGEDKIRALDTFSSVTAGLGIIAHQIETGQIELRAYTPDDAAPPSQARGSRPKIHQANFDLLQKRIVMEEGALADDAESISAETQTLVLIDDALGISAVVLPDGERVELEANGFVPQAGVVATLDEILLLLTSQYRFLLTTPRQLLDLDTMGMQITDLHQLAERETLCAIGSWSKIRSAERLLVVTNLGMARAYPLNVLQASIEAPMPLKFDHPLPGLPVAVLGASLDQQFVLVTGEGRGWRWPVRSLSVRGTQAINCGQTDRVTAATLAQSTDELVLISADGYARKLLADGVAQAPKPNQKGRSLFARRSPVVGLTGPSLLVADGHSAEMMTPDLEPTTSTKSVRVVARDAISAVVAR